MRSGAATRCVLILTSTILVVISTTLTITIMEQQEVYDARNDFYGDSGTTIPPGAHFYDEIFKLDCRKYVHLVSYRVSRLCVHVAKITDSERDELRDFFNSLTKKHLGMLNLPHIRGACAINAKLDTVASMSFTALVSFARYLEEMHKLMM